MAIEIRKVEAVRMHSRSLLKVLPLACLVLAGCQHRWEPEPEFGVAVRNLAAAQYVNPSAPVGSASLGGLDGPAAQATIKTYQKSFESPKSQGLGTVSGGAGGSGSSGGSSGSGGSSASR